MWNLVYNTKHHKVNQSERCSAMCSLNANKNSTLATNQICQNPTSKVIEVGNEQKLELFMYETLLNINAYFKTKQLTMNLDFDEGFGLPLCSSSTFFEMRQGAPLVVIR